jgi:cardiolipin synthase
VPVATVLIYFDIIIPALAVYFAACVTDLLDGYVARKRNLITEEGALLDPLADKLMAIFVIAAFTVKGVLPIPILIILLLKELLMVGGGIYLYFKKIVTPANKFGKVAAFTLNTAIGVTFLHDYSWFASWYKYFLYLGLALMLAALGQYAYFNMYKKLWKKSNY